MLKYGLPQKVVGTKSRAVSSFGGFTKAKDLSERTSIPIVGNEIFSKSTINRINIKTYLRC